MHIKEDMSGGNQDGRPQGPTSPHPRRPRPYYTMKRPDRPVYSRGGSRAELGGDPCGRPSDVYDHASSPYLKCISPCACPRHHRRRLGSISSTSRTPARTSTRPPPVPTSAPCPYKTEGLLAVLSYPDLVVNIHYRPKIGLNLKSSPFVILSEAKDLRAT